MQVDDQNDKDHQGDSGRSHDGQIHARFASVLDCREGILSGDPRRVVLLLTMGNADGDVDQIAIEMGDGVRLLRLLERTVTSNGRGVRKKRIRLTPPKARKRARGQRTEDAILNTQVRMQFEGAEQFSERIERVEPQLLAYLEEELKAVFSKLVRNCKSARGATAIQNHIREVVLIAVHLARGIR